MQQKLISFHSLTMISRQNVQASIKQKTKYNYQNNQYKHSLWKITRLQLYKKIIKK